MALTVSQLASGYGRLQVLFGISLEVPERSIVSLIGPNGAGKTTTLLSIMGVVKPWGGSVVFNGRDITKAPPYEKVEMGLALVPEGRRLFIEMTVEENLLMGAYTRRAREKMYDTLEFVYTLFPRLKERRRQKAGTMSGGEQQMLALARALMSRPKVLLIDEPSAGLAPKVVNDLFQTIRQLREDMAILLVEQNVAASLEISDYVYVLENGRIVLQGDPREVVENEHIKKAYLGV
ncbi:amino acid/amide ABC transporter ATP-binding protein 2, HAAT family [Pyrobaculum islandicum DSM 4184]|uniref:Amino acid/amide ABC transporter ATP-binding protein 2, HAAT family n=1 Tax=Pyrobaculum islandicum (strain DSM 4184 / JCM 9189 / GEO3) TaxID=384616 RepID=A1RUP3_PYRIL|nr:ABC transporter ATP-binding protein [Pyrobaculum islandicum]ABL88675.1 amino acid/amide ABC transporter ATP-binding protein 2, HAAT family [Pyrobaculum islandicum DSM 4184]